MPYISGRSLDRLDDAEKPLAGERIANIGAQAAHAITHAHARGIIHRDIKPANLLLDEQGLVWITDFGVAGFLEDLGEGTGTIVGTPRYVAPEQLAGKAEPRSDVYGLGITLYELATGRRPFEDCTVDSLAVAVRAADPPPPRSLRPDLPIDLETIIVQAIAKEPKDRYGSALAMAEDLERFARGEPILARKVGRFERLRKWAKRKPAQAALVAVSIAALVAILGGGAYYNHQLRGLLKSESSARQLAADNAEKARERMELALKANRQLIAEVKQLEKAGVTRPMQQRLLQTALGGLEEIAKSYETSEPDVHRAEAHHNLGVLYFELGKLDKAIEQAESQTTIARQLFDPVRPDTKVILGKALLDLSNYYIRKNRIDDAERAAGELAAMVDLTTDYSVFARLANGARSNLIDACIRKRQFDRALDMLTKQQASLQELRNRDPGSMNVLVALSESYDRQRAISELQGDIAKARDYIRKQVELGRILVKSRSQSSQIRQNHLTSLANLGNCLLQLNELPAAREVLVEAEDVGKTTVASDPHNVNCKINLANVFICLGNLEKLSNAPVESRKWFGKARELLCRLRDEGKLVDHPFERDVVLPDVERHCKMLETLAK